MKLSVVLATRNEEKNIGDCLESVKKIADEIVIADEESSDKTREIAKKYGALVFTTKHEPNFHITKQKAIEKAKGEWILQLDADERVTAKLENEILHVIDLNGDELQARKIEIEKKNRLFARHQRLIESREKIHKNNGEVVAFFLPRINVFLGKPLVHAGVYPDGVIRLFKNGKARLPGKSVHELMEVDGNVSWLENSLEHHESPTFGRYLDRMNRYTDLEAEDLKKRNVSVSYWNLFNYSFVVPTFRFLNLYLRHKGFMDGMRGFIWSLFSALHFPISYFKYWQAEKNGI